MSGTSLDGLDVVHVQLAREGTAWTFHVDAAETIPFPPSWYQRLCQVGELSGQELIKMDLEFGQWLATVVRDFLARHKSPVDLIASHGHTVFHQPEIGLTYQMGHGGVLAAGTGLTVVNDFRSQDMALGGQGAPLVPIGDQLLFGEYDFCLNLGGIANVSWVRGTQRLALDICPVNQVLNYLSGRMGLKYDSGGDLARKGRTNQVVLRQLNGLDFYAQAAPKSLGREWIEKSIFPILLQQENSIPDLLNTCNHHIAHQISQVLLSAKDPSDASQRILTTGGGAYNTFLIELLQAMIGPGLNIVVPEPTVVEYKEAVVFALMGALRMEDQVNIYKTVTGASTDHSAGQIWRVLN